MRLSKIAVAACATACTAVLWKGGQLIAAEPIPRYQLCQVQVVFRHGARTPLFVPEYLPSVSYEQGLMNYSSKTQINYKIVSLVDDSVPYSPLDESYMKQGFLKGGCLPGQLTNVGADQMYELGRYLRKRYMEDKDFLSHSFSSLKNEIYTRSTNVARTVTSARCVLAGLFEEKGDQPLEIHVSCAEDEILYPNYVNCARLKELSRWAWANPDKVPGNCEIRKAIGKALNIPEDVEINLTALKDNFVAEEAHGKQSLKASLDVETLKSLDQGAMKIMMGAFVGMKEVRNQSLKLAIGSFVDVLLSNMEDFANGQNAVKLNLYSGHDTTLLPLLSALGIDISNWPPYASNIIFELYRKNVSGKSEYFVKVLYNGEEQRITGEYSTMCPLATFIKSMESIRLTHPEYRKLCDMPSEMPH